MYILYDIERWIEYVENCKVWAWEAWDEECVSEDQLEHDWLCLKALADSAADFS